MANNKGSTRRCSGHAELQAPLLLTNWPANKTKVTTTRHSLIGLPLFVQMSFVIAMMGSDYEFIYVAINSIFSNLEGSALIRKKKEVFIRLDGVSITPQALSKMKERIGADEGYIIDAKTFWRKA